MTVGENKLQSDALRSSRHKQKGENHPLTAACLFAGMGGFSMAFQKAGFKILWANDSDAHASSTYRHNFPHVRFHEKVIEELTVAGDDLEPVDVLTAGFPCQPFSVAGRKSGFEDARGRLFFEISRLVREFGSLRPRIIVMENVRHLLNHDQGKTFSRILTSIQQAGYWFRPRNVAILNTRLHTRIPQNRERLFMVAMNWDVFNLNDFRFPAEDDIVDPVADYLDLDQKADDDLYFDDRSKYGRMFLEEIKKGQDSSVYQLRRYYVRENKNECVFTLTANMGEGGHNVPVIKDDWGIRKLTPRECLRLQGFEDGEFSFPEELSKTQRYRQIGNTVTVPLVLKIAEECMRQLRSRVSVARRSE